MERPPTAPRRRLTTGDHGHLSFHPTIELDGSPTAWLFLEQIENVRVPPLLILLAYVMDGAAVDAQQLGELRGFKANAVWNVTVEALRATSREVPLAEPRLVMFTPHERRLSLFLHQSRFLGVQVEVPGVIE